MKLGIFLLLFMMNALAYASFDVPLEIKHVDLGPSKTSPSSRDEVTCFYFDKFMVKQIDLSEKGAAQLSILRFSKNAKRPACQKKNVTQEMIVDSEGWIGYFKGVKSHYVFFDADDGWNGAMSFAVFDANTGKKVFSDAAVGDIDLIEKSAKVGLRYGRAYLAPCALLVEGKDCWEKVMSATGIRDMHAPDCVTGYRKSKRDWAHTRCDDESDYLACFQKEMNSAQFQEVDKSKAMLEYPVEILDLSAPAPQPLGTATACWPPS